MLNHGSLEKDYQFCEESFHSLVGQTITRVSYEPWSVRLLFEEGQLLIENGWRLLDESDSIIDEDQDHEERSTFNLWKITGRRIERVAFEYHPFICVSLLIENNWRMEITANDDGLEDWNLAFGNTLIICNGDIISIFK